MKPGPQQLTVFYVIQIAGVDCSMSGVVPAAWSGFVIMLSPAPHPLSLTAIWRPFMEVDFVFIHLVLF